MELLRIGDIYWTAPSTLQATIAAPQVSHSLCLRFPHTVHLPREPMLCLHPAFKACALDIIKRWDTTVANAAMVSPAPHEDQEHCCKNQKQPAGCLKKQPAGCLKAVQSLHVHGTEEGHHSSERSHGKPSTKTRSIVAKIRCALAAPVICT